MKMYRLESDLVEAVVPALEIHFRSQGMNYRICREVIAGRAVADIVIVSSKVGMMPRWTEALSLKDCVILASLRRNGAAGIDDLASRCCTTPDDLRSKCLDRLSDWGLVNVTRRGRISATRDWPGSVEIVAIEAKLKRWRSALSQAAQYRRYADRSFVVLPSECTSRRISVEAFAAAGVGLLTFDGETIDTLVDAANSNDHDWRREFVISRLAPLISE